jgi:hypothetical protein
VVALTSIFPSLCANVLDAHVEHFDILSMI